MKKNPAIACGPTFFEYVLLGVFYLGLLLFGFDLASALAGCGSASAITQAQVTQERASIDAYLGDKQSGAAFRGSFYDSLAAWNESDSTLTSHLAAHVGTLRSGDSLATYTLDFYGYERTIADAELSEIYSVARP